MATKKKPEQADDFATEWDRRGAISCSLGPNVHRELSILAASQGLMRNEFVECIILGLVALGKTNDERAKRLGKELPELLPSRGKLRALRAQLRPEMQRR